MITQKMKYALKALIVLAEEQATSAKPLTIEEIARRSDAPKRFLEHILLDLRNGGYLSSARGRIGGYALALAASSVALSEVIRLIDGPIAPLPCLSRRFYRRCEDCKDEATCQIRLVFDQAYSGYLTLIESMTLADVMNTRRMEQDAVPR